MERRRKWRDNLQEKEKEKERVREREKKQTTNTKNGLTMIL